MSGGSMNYAFRHLEDMADYVEDREIKDLLNDLSNLMHDLEWWQSGDYSSSDYYESLDEFKKKWFGNNRNERLREYLNSELDDMKSKIEKLI